MGIIKKVIGKNMFFGAKAEVFTLSYLPPLTWERGNEGERPVNQTKPTLG